MSWPLTSTRFTGGRLISLLLSLHGNIGWLMNMEQQVCITAGCFYWHSAHFILSQLHQLEPRPLLMNINEQVDVVGKWQATGFMIPGEFGALFPAQERVSARVQTFRHVEREYDVHRQPPLCWLHSLHQLQGFVPIISVQHRCWWSNLSHSLTTTAFYCHFKKIKLKVQTWSESQFPTIQPEYSDATVVI